MCVPTRNFLKEKETPSFSRVPISAWTVLDSVDDFVRTGGRIVVAFVPMDDDFELEALRRLKRDRDRAKARIANGESLSEKDDEVEGDSAEPEEETATPASETEATHANDEAQDAPPATIESEVGADSDEAPVTESAEDTDSAENKAEDDDDEEPIYGIGPAELKSQDISERWDFDYGFDMAEETTSVATDLPLEAEMRLRSGLFFQVDNDVWTAIYARSDTEEGKPSRTTIIERRLGEGTIVLCSDSYFLSNEALRRDRSPALIQWVVGDNPTLLFSEVHLGNGQRDRIMTLVRRYRLHGLMLGLALIAALFIWRNTSTLLPRRERLTSDQLETEKSLQGGLENLLIRFVPPTSLVSLCVKEWRQHFGNGPHTAAVNELFVANSETGKTSKDENNIVAIYNQISREVRKRDRN